MRLIGKGLFTKCYLNPDQKTVTLRSSCPIKECVSFDWFPSTPMFPKIQRLGYLPSGTGVYQMKYYPKVKSLKSALKPSEYEWYKLLREIAKGIHPANKYDRYHALYAAFEAIPSKWAIKRQHMLDALSACANYGSDIGFEVSPRNVAVDKGRLVLLDCFFMVSAAERARGGR